MCSIIGSFSKTKFKELVSLNQNRGSFSYSFLVLDPSTLKIVSLIQDFGEFPLDIIDMAQSKMYMIGHTQAPTGGLVEDPNIIHPAQVDHKFLFHNGIIKHKDVRRLKDELKTYEFWDSKLMLMDIIKNGMIPSFYTIDGSFACVYKDNNSIKLFRSAAGTLFVDNKLNISSTKFSNVPRIDKDTIFDIDFSNKSISKINSFTSKSNPYFY